MLPASKRTDLALDSFNNRADLGSLRGAMLKEYTTHGIAVTELTVSDAHASDVLCKPVGKYYTVDVTSYIQRKANAFSAAANCLSELLRSYTEVSKSSSFLIACLGNSLVTPDAVGPLCADSLIVTRHLKVKANLDFAFLSSVAVLRTGVLGTSGIESACAVSAICRELKPDCIIAVDALATSEFDRLCRTVQICDSGISPGSGVGNNRAELSRETLGVPVIAIGVPTVIDASAICRSSSTDGMFVTPRNIDELVASASKLIAYGVNLSLHRGLSISDIEALVE